ncbi:LOW QUALITY PROTEIN: tetra-peptide repeat homeobox protein 1 [Nomascus leucogenys]|uniref:LOW QUALITY PROTEIN: tetra-peptide repeat homeobox protein 1 n=1 Tax=Nomascus leucogenys TaxID=61853 RepID=UPI00122D63F9|nr:LOW QUALITY PROTEIN: tetra-peptide repeat homeobox protein 1 [Nomascus leucogenys]
MDEAGNHHSEQTITRTENQTPHALTHRRMESCLSCSQLYSQYLGLSQTHSSPPLAPDPPRRQRQERTVYNQSQQEVLELYFQKEQYPNYDERLNLAKTLGFREQQLQVWFKNRRAKLARVRRLQQQPQRVPGRRGRGARAAPLVLAAAASAPQPGPSGILPAAEPTICSLDQAWGGPGCRAQKGIPAALSPGPGPVPAPIPGPAQVPGPIPGPISGPVQIPGPFRGPIPGPIPGPAQIPGPIPGPNPGLIPGPFRPSQIPGPFRGPIPGPIPGPAQIPGPISGPISSPNPGPAQIPGPISGPISSPNPGLIPGQISGPGPIIDPIPGPAQIPGPGRLRGPGPILSPGRMRSPGSLPGLAPILGPGPGSGSASIPGPGSLPAPAPLWPQSPDASDFLPDTQLFPHFTELLPPLDPLEGSSVSTMTSQYQEGDDSMGKKDSGSQHQDEGGSVNENHSGPRSLLDL